MSVFFQPKIKKFCKQNSLPGDLIYDGMQQLDEQEQQLLSVLINYKDGKEFLYKLKNGEI